MSPGGIRQVSQWLAPWEKDTPDLRNWEWYYLKGLCHRDLLTLRGHGGGVLALAWSKDGRLASAGSDRIVRIWDADLGQEIHRFAGHDHRLEPPRHRQRQREHGQRGVDECHVSL